MHSGAYWQSNTAVDKSFRLECCYLGIIVEATRPKSTALKGIWNQQEMVEVGAVLALAVGGVG